MCKHVAALMCRFKGYVGMPSCCDLSCSLEELIFDMRTTASFLAVCPVYECVLYLVGVLLFWPASFVVLPSLFHARFSLHAPHPTSPHPFASPPHRTYRIPSYDASVA